MKISLITVCYNAESNITDCLKSVKSQDYPNLEYIIVDGGSNDATLDIVNKFSDIISILISEPDKGIYDALNKGIAAASGDIIGIMHSDDFFAQSNILTEVAKAFITNKADLLYGNLDYVNRINIKKITRRWRSQEYDDQLFLNGWMPAHPTFYAKKSCFLTSGNYDLRFKSAADYDLMLRFFYKTNYKKYFLNIVMVKMRVGGKSNVTLSNRWYANREDYQSLKKNLIPFPLKIILFKPLRKIWQFFR
ncbi:MAG: glycosyltransferase [Sphingobacteriales bacterium]|nr:MAG: glycosyltransferase [Sphingobacteriales bacterium]